MKAARHQGSRWGPNSWSDARQRGSVPRGLGERVEPVDGPQRAARRLVAAIPAESVSSGRDPNCRRPFERRAVRVERRPVHRLVASATRPRGVAAAVPEAGLMPNQDLVRAESVPVGASRRRESYPRFGRGLHQLAQHDYKPKASTGTGPSREEEWPPQRSPLPPFSAWKLSGDCRRTAGRRPSWM